MASVIRGDMFYRMLRVVWICTLFDSGCWTSVYVTADVLPSCQPVNITSFVYMRTMMSHLPRVGVWGASSLSFIALHSTF